VHRPTVVIDCFPESASQYQDGHAIVAIDVIRAATTAVTAVAGGRRCFPVASFDAAMARKRTLAEALLVGEIAGAMPFGFDLNNSPADLAARRDVARPIVLLSSSGTRLMDAARHADAAYVACFRNARALGRALAGRHARIAVIGAGSREEFRDEDQICCAWVASELVARGYRAADLRTRELIARWGTAPAGACAEGKSADYLRRSGQGHDLDFILTHVDDLDAVFAVSAGEVVMRPAPLSASDAYLDLRRANGVLQTSRA